ncbi:MAG: hypothetical protein PHV82_13245 [Victivallaceae bacterium]|nr:hypothetical protein [Victivallaceae bacterium]
MKSALEVLDALKLDRSFLPVLEIGWRESMDTYPAAAGLYFMEHRFYLEHLALAGLENDLAPMMNEVADKVKKSTDLRFLAWHAHHYLCLSNGMPSFAKWPELNQIFGKNCGIFYLMIGLSSIPVLSRTYHAMGIPETYAAASAKWLSGTVEIYKSAHAGYPGHTRKQLFWMRNYINGKLFRIGRFEFMEQDLPKSFPISVYKSKKTGQVIALAAAGTACSADGLILYADQAPENAAFTTSFTRNATVVAGNPISPRGFIMNQTVRMPLAEWKCILAPGDFTPDIHIPGGGGMNMEVCRESLQEALKFYEKYFPEKRIKAFVCGSWIFNTDWECLLPESNLAKFMRQTYLFPMPSSGKDGLFFIFGKEQDDISEYPRNNSLRRAMLSILDKGKRLRTGGMFYLPEHLSQFGTEYYRTAWKLPDNIVG